MVHFGYPFAFVSRHQWWSGSIPSAEHQQIMVCPSIWTRIGHWMRFEDGPPIPTCKIYDIRGSTASGNIFQLKSNIGFQQKISTSAICYMASMGWFATVGEIRWAEVRILGKTGINSQDPDFSAPAKLLRPWAHKTSGSSSVWYEYWVCCMCQCSAFRPPWVSAMLFYDTLL